MEHGNFASSIHNTKQKNNIDKLSTSNQLLVILHPTILLA